MSSPRRCGLCHVSFAMCLLSALAAAAIAQSAPAPAAAHASAKPSTALHVATPGGEITLSLRELQALPQTSVTVHNAHLNADERYTGVKLQEILAKAGAAPDKATLHSYVIATGSDGYWVLYSGEEVSDLLHAGTVMVAVEKDGAPLQADGALKLISSEDRKPERWVRNLAAIHWVETKP